ncbi:MAG: TonB-dependent receptor [Chitinophagaceae bacterium]|nr:TonB-dependent receptor [Chitinophagaceae bacterium]
MAKALSLVVFVLISFAVGAQNTAKGSVSEREENKPIANAIISLIRPADSILVKFTRTDETGEFSLNNIPEGNYIMMVSHPRYGDLIQDIRLKAGENDFSVQLIPKAKLMEEIIIKTTSSMKIKGDTTIFFADSFIVSPNANVEELLKKLPGLQVDKDGKITAMGKSVEKVLVDGEEFFGNDPGMAVKNLRADAVKEVQVFDKKSDLAEFTGIDDGKTQKTINLKLKDDAKRGYFGKADVAAGPLKDHSARYNSNLMFSTFKNQRKLSAFLLNGNTGQDGLNWEDQMQYGGMDANIQVTEGGGIAIYSTSGSEDEPYVNPRNGFMTNNNAGLQYSNKWANKYSFNFTPRYNNQQYTNNTFSFNQTQIGDSVINRNTNTTNSVNRYNFQLKGKWDLQFDSMNTLKININSAFYHSEGGSDMTSSTTGGNGTLKNTSSRNLSTTSDRSNTSADITYQHKFKKPRRTLSVSANWQYGDNKALSFLRSMNLSFLDGQPSGSQTVNQQKNSKGNTTNSGLTVSYTEPLSKELSLLFSHRITYNKGSNSQTTNAYSPGSGKYDQIVDSLTNDFRQEIVENTPSAKINFANKKWKINVGAGFGFTSFKLRDITLSKDYNRSYINFYPSSNLKFTYKPNHSINVGYSGSTTQPTINQLQPLRNNNDYFNQYIGNADLKPSFNHNINFGHDSYNFLKNIYTYLGGGITFTENAITNHQYINLDSGKTITQPVNVNGNSSFYIYGGGGFKIKPLDINVNLSPNLDFSKYVGLLNNKKTISKTFNPGIRISLYKDKEFKYSWVLSYSIGYNSTITSENNTRIHYITSNLMPSLTIYYHKVWSLITDYNYSYNQKMQKSDKDINIHLLNMRLQRTFSNNQFTAYIAVRDLLNQNQDIQRSFYGTSFSEIRNDRLKRYFLAGFTWNFKNKSAGTK